MGRVHFFWTNNWLGGPPPPDHLFCTCDIFCRVWFLVLQWLHLYFVPHIEIRSHLLHFGHLGGYRIVLICSFE